MSAVDILFGVTGHPRYEWRRTSGGHVASGAASAQVVGEFLEELRVEHGVLTPRLVLDAARLPSAPIHRLFNWEDDKAAERWREQQARSLLGSIVVKIRPFEDSQIRTTRAFVNFRTANGAHRYTSIAVMLTDPDMTKQVLARALAELEQWRQRHAHLVELTDIFDAIEHNRVARAAVDHDEDQPGLGA